MWHCHGLWACGIAIGLCRRLWTDVAALGAFSAPSSQFDRGLRKSFNQGAAWDEEGLRTDLNVPAYSSRQSESNTYQQSDSNGHGHSKSYVYRPAVRHSPSPVRSASAQRVIAQRSPSNSRHTPRGQSPHHGEPMTIGRDSHASHRRSPHRSDSRQASSYENRTKAFRDELAEMRNRTRMLLEQAAECERLSTLLANKIETELGSDEEAHADSRDSPSQLQHRSYR